MSFELRLLADSDIPALQAIYDARPGAFQRLIGRPALPDQAAADFLEGITQPGRYQFGVSFDGGLIGFADLKLKDREEGAAQLGLILLAPPFNNPDIAALVLRVLERWLVQVYSVKRIQAGVPAHDLEELLFWQAQGYRFTGGQYRRDLPGYAPRFLILMKELTTEGTSS